MRALLLVAVFVFALAASGRAFAQGDSPANALVESLMSQGFKDKPFALRIQFEVKESAKAEFEAAAARVAVMTNLKDGCMSYRFHWNLATPAQVMLFEEWPNAVLLEEHLAAPHTQAFLAKMPDLVAGPLVMTIYRPAQTPKDDEVEDATKLKAVEGLPTPPKVVDQLKALGGGEEPFVLLVDIPVQPNALGLFRQAMAKATPGTLKEQGCLRYSCYQQADAPEMFLLFEWWENAAAIESHLAEPHFQELLPMIGKASAKERTRSFYSPLPY